ncbi:YbaK/EbsC family protein [Wenxinia saemankumensis]|uniref:Cys-tRNA(Pro) deacylase, prolyl-tRNA editing enzyme YbaK/EbsC n=1 Tax=Wenxinia saemankumensis TaxID=1447782 RepID=A0A1M6AI92_9RHOB|nr:YbaK/EbsC family protein [Wenxinia saemankumensis]SHI36101.1 Cys-tRNA(Pro) deacylase, prolyl-tRNA editing enzyme YbaK/EbsC [Wenxinia saemankumensis]
MSKSLARVAAALQEAGLTEGPREVGESRMALQAARAVGCELDQIAKSIVFVGARSRRTYLFLTAGGNRVSPEKAADLVGEPLAAANGAEVRERTGFAIGGVSPVGATGPMTILLDPRLTGFDIVWAAAGTPRHVFPISPADLQRITGAAPGDFTE